MGDQEWLSVCYIRGAGSGISHMTDGQMSFQALDCALGKNLWNQTHVFDTWSPWCRPTLQSRRSPDRDAAGHTVRNRSIWQNPDDYKCRTLHIRGWDAYLMICCWYFVTSKAHPWLSEKPTAWSIVAINWRSRFNSAIAKTGKGTKRESLCLSWVSQK